MEVTCSNLAEIGTYAKLDFGPVRWMGPESIEKSVFTIKSDVYAFGMTIVEIVTRKRPYAKIEDNIQVGKSIMKGALNPLDEIPEGFSQMLKDLVKKCTNKDRDQRPGFDPVNDIVSAPSFRIRDPKKEETAKEEIKKEEVKKEEIKKEEIKKEEVKKEEIKKVESIKKEEIRKEEIKKEEPEIEPKPVEVKQEVKKEEFAPVVNVKQVTKESSESDSEDSSKSMISDDFEEDIFLKRDAPRIEEESDISSGEDVAPPAKPPSPTKAVPLEEEPVEVESKEEIMEPPPIAEEPAEDVPPPPIRESSESSSSSEEESSNSD